MPAFMYRGEIWKLIKSFENKQKIAHRSMERAMIVVKRKKGQHVSVKGTKY